MRYIGNKTKLLGFIRQTLAQRGIRPGTAVDPFSGTASVASALKSWGFDVVASDLMEYAYVFGKAYVEVSGPPDLSGVRGAPAFVATAGHPSGLAPATEPAASVAIPTPDPTLVTESRPTESAATIDGGASDGELGLRDVVALLNGLPGRPGFIHEHFTPAGEAGSAHGRMYFTPENAARIDAIRETIEAWRCEGRIGDEAYFVLLAALIEAADAVANTAGVYAACIKSWQPNALRPLRMRAPRIVARSGSRAYRRDAFELVSELEPFDLLYLDPPYNTRQYPAYYHIPELIASGWFDAAVKLRGKTGLLEDTEKRSDWCRRNRCEDAFEALVATAKFRHLVMSYNAEGIISESTIERVLKTYGSAVTYRRYTRPYKRYRSDADGENRRYRGDDVVEYLYCVERRP